ncbi:MAG: hypothetical protein LBS10_08805 [Gracilibacteraceae bacterium]|jgi:hypothetical protein|nr:hypothetical protein [Gracilibacteraceae bacterium]
MTLFFIYLRALGRQWPLFLLLIACQLLLGEMSSVALNSKKPDLAIALALESDGPLARRYALALEQIPDLRIIKTTPAADRAEIFAAHSVQGLAVITPQFDQQLESGGGGAVLLYPAPGVGDISLAREFLAAEAVMLRADILWQRQLGFLGAEVSGAPAPASARPILTLVYEGPAAPAQPLSVPPAFGVPALFLLPAFLQAARMAPGPDDRRLLLRGRRALRRAGAAFAAALGTAWGLTVLLYILGLDFFYRIAVPPLLAAVLLFLAFYAAALGCLVAAAGARSRAVWIFIPWFLLNMTLGGGLWNLPLPSPLLLPLLPLGSVAAAQSGLWAWLWALVALTATAIIICFACSGRRVMI